MVSFSKLNARRDGVGRIAGFALTSVVPLVDVVRCWFRGSGKSESGCNELRSDLLTRGAHHHFEVRAERSCVLIESTNLWRTDGLETRHMGLAPLGKLRSRTYFPFASHARRKA